MKSCTTSLVLLLLVVPALWSQGKPEAGKPGAATVIRPKESDPTIWVTFVPVPRGVPVLDVGGGRGTLDLGSISYLTGATREGVNVSRRAQSYVISTAFGLRVGGAGSTGTAKLLGFLVQPLVVHKIWIDGVRLSLTPQILQMTLKYGMVSEHRLEIEVPVDAPETAAQCLNAIAFQILPD